MTNEQWVREWIGRKWGRKFALDEPDRALKLTKALATGVLVDADPSEGVSECGCGIAVGRGLRFMLDDIEFMTICPKCDSWAIFSSRRFM